MTDKKIAPARTGANDHLDGDHVGIVYTESGKKVKQIRAGRAHVAAIVKPTPDGLHSCTADRIGQRKLWNAGERINPFLLVHYARLMAENDDRLLVEIQPDGIPAELSISVGAFAPVSGRLSGADLQGLRQQNPLPDVAGAVMKLHKAGNEWKGLCPFHSERTPSFTIYEGGGRFKCFGCNVAGDVMDFVQAAYGLNFLGAVDLLGGGDLPKVAIAAQIASQCDDKADRRPEALAIWEAAQEATATPAERYLRARGISMALPPSIRFAALPYGKNPALHPALVALVQLPDGEPIGIQRTFLNPAGTGKAAVPKPRLSLGNIRGGAIQLGSAGPELTICEGIEDGLTLAQERGDPVWVGVGTSGMAAIQMPNSVRKVTIGADADEAGERAAQKAGKRLAEKGLGALIIRPLSPYKDFNAELIGGAA